MAGFATLVPQPADLATLRKAHLIEDGAHALDAFLASVERKAFRIAQIALRHEADALDVVQDAMLQLSTRYASRPAQEWKPLFYRILENRIRDVQRRRSVRNRVMALVPWRSHEAEGDPDDLIAQYTDGGPTPGMQLESEQMLATLERALEALPRRQRQAFLLRNFEGLDVAQTALAMKCSEGSVKTHYFRALQVLREKLGEFRS